LFNASKTSLPEGKIYRLLLPRLKNLMCWSYATKARKKISMGLVEGLLDLPVSVPGKLMKC
ncbi:MAG: hypothetical protein P4L51_15310, partial [Puia sp.]|nr:hypothetical protein [Puia sp.]